MAVISGALPRLSVGTYATTIQTAARDGRGFEDRVPERAGPTTLRKFRIREFSAPTQRAISTGLSSRHGSLFVPI